MDLGGVGAVVGVVVGVIVSGKDESEDKKIDLHKST